MTSIDYRQDPPQWHDRADQLVTDAATEFPTWSITSILLIAHLDARSTATEWREKDQERVARAWDGIAREIRIRMTAHREAVTA